MANRNDAEVIDLTEFTAVPALIDVHTHLTFGPTRGGGGRSPVVNMVLGQESARKTLEAGVTTVRDLNSTEFLDVAMRDLINLGAMVGPRMFVAGYGLKITGGKQGAGRPPTGGFADGPDEVMKVVRQQIAAGVDWIKLFGSTGGMDDDTGLQTFTFDEIKAAVDAAHNLGVPVAVHAYGPAAAHDAVMAGVDSIEHAVEMESDTIAEMARKRIFYVPTIDHNRYYIENCENMGFSAESKSHFDDIIQKTLETTKRAFTAGVPIAMGSDANFTMFGENTQELKWFHRAGMSPKDVLATATTGAATLLRKQNELGKIAPGFLADIIAVDGDPTSDISCLTDKVLWVMKEGKIMIDKTVGKEREQLKIPQSNQSFIQERA
jgi:imidazolonepropionase-like amidohydrolase